MNKLVPLTAVKRQAVIRVSADRELIVRCGKNSSRYIYVVNIANIGLFRHIPFDAQINDIDLLRICYVLYKYVLRIGDSRELRKFRCLPKDWLPVIRDEVFASRHMLSYKLATITCMMNNLRPAKHLIKIRDIFRSFGLSKDDALLYILMFHNGDAADLVASLVKVEEGCALHLDGLKNELTIAEQKILRSAAISNAYKKLRFVYEGNRLTIEDMVGELLTRAVQAYYWVRPFYNKRHALNYAVSSMQKQALNIIRHYTDPRRARIVQDGDGYTNVIMDFGALVPSDGFSEDAMHLYIDYCNGKIAA